MRVIQRNLIRRTNTLCKDSKEIQIASRRKARVNVLLEWPKQNTKFQSGKMRQNIKRGVIACILIINLPLSVLSRIPFSYWPRNSLSIYSVRKTNICRRSKASRRANILVLRTSRFQGTTIRPIVRRHKHSIFFIVHHKIFLCVPVQKSYWIIFNFCRWKSWQPNENDLKK